MTYTNNNSLNYLEIVYETGIKYLKNQFTNLRMEFNLLNEICSKIENYNGTTVNIKKNNRRF